ncbi:unnamed protein product [Paramecium sonneborni]|uniref:Uncharacterized protein n=1 Tax=Paramecium sonneborni TaxID=65129 RepID=A0A8S1NKJ2_9CILI|nr:unnamed protein product [Paramecium sonneborni]
MIRKSFCYFYDLIQQELSRDYQYWQKYRNPIPYYKLVIYQFYFNFNEINNCVNYLKKTLFNKFEISFNRQIDRNSLKKFLITFIYQNRQKQKGLAKLIT